MTAPIDLARDIASAINRVSRENVSNTPDFILAEMLVDILTAFEKASNARETWYGRGVHAIVSEGGNREGGEANLPDSQRRPDGPDTTTAAPDPDPGSPCPACDGSGIFMGGRGSLVAPVCKVCNGTGRVPPPGIASRDVMGDLERELNMWRAKAETAERTLAEATNELHCCDDIPLDRGLAAGIAALQQAREAAERERDELIKANTTAPERRNT